MPGAKYWPLSGGEIMQILRALVDRGLIPASYLYTSDDLEPERWGEPHPETAMMMAGGIGMESCFWQQTEHVLACTDMAILFEGMSGCYTPRARHVPLIAIREYSKSAVYTSIVQRQDFRKITACIEELVYDFYSLEYDEDFLPEKTQDTVVTSGVHTESEDGDAVDDDDDDCDGDDVHSTLVDPLAQ